MKLKAWALYLIAGIGFTFTGIIKFAKKNHYIGIAFVFLGVAYFILSAISYKGINKLNKKELSNEELKDINDELKNLISEGESIRAIKKYRMATGEGLVEAKKYVDSLSEKMNRE